MTVELALLEDFVEPASQMTNEEFLNSHSGVYLVAMGALDADMAPQNDVNAQTSEMRLPLARPRHNRSQSSLNGRLFVIRPENDDSSILLGRQNSAELMIPDNSVSGNHARLRICDRKSVYIQDLASKNGTSVNNTRISAEKETKLQDGDLLTFGRYSFQFFRPATLHAALRLIR